MAVLWLGQAVGTPGENNSSGCDEERVAQSGASPVTRHEIGVQLSWGHQSKSARGFAIRLTSQHAALGQMRGEDLEPGDSLAEGLCASRAGGGEVDGLRVTVSWSEPVEPRRKVHSIWQHLLDHGERGQVARLRDDPGLQPDAPLLTVFLAEDEALGFTIGLEQLARHRAMWLPEHDVFVTLADAPVEWSAHVAGLKGERMLDRVRQEPEATLAEWRDRWQDFGDPDQAHHGHETEWLGTKGHLTGLIARHGALYKFGVDRWGRVRPDHASPHRFRFDPLWAGAQWKGQRIVKGLPVLVTEVEADGKRWRLEQFAGPLRQAPVEKRGDIPSVCFTKAQVTGPGPIRLGFRVNTENPERHPELREVGGHWCVVDRESGGVWLMIEPDRNITIAPRATVAHGKNPGIEFDCAGELAAGAAGVVIFKLASPVVPADQVDRLAALDYQEERGEAVRYWEGWLAFSARFEVPEAAVNELFRASLWHALFLPRHRADEHGAERIDLPYSNFAYGQLNADWPINQAVYVDYMIHGLRGYFEVAEAELAAMYRSQQQPDGRVGGYANWGVYSPGMLYAVAKNFLLSDDRAAFERLLPASMRAMDWCLGEIAKGRDHPETPGLIVAPLNDLTHAARAWGFPNGYFVAGLEMFARALAQYGHPRAAAVAAVARDMGSHLTQAFARASVRSPVVQLADGTWINYVPSDALTPRRLLDEWYPTDVDTGPLHMSRLGALDPRGWLTTAMLHDHEDNLFLNQWGMANEPVYNQQATAYLLRDEPEAAIRAFYSMTACAFSHGQLTPLEHRWAWGQYYMPPSTDGAWLELYRNLLVREADAETLMLCPAAPRKWLADGGRITVGRAPTYFGPLSFAVASRAGGAEIRAAVDVPDRRPPGLLLLRVRHPARRPMQSVQVNGRDWNEFDPAREWVRIPKPAGERYDVLLRY